MVLPVASIFFKLSKQRFTHGLRLRLPHCHELGLPQGLRGRGLLPVVDVHPPSGQAELEQRGELEAGAGVVLGREALEKKIPSIFSGFWNAISGFFTVRGVHLGRFEPIIRISVR